MYNEALCKSKLGTLEGALALIKTGDTIATSLYGNEPSAFINALHTVADRLERVTLWAMMMMGKYPVMRDNSLKGKIDIHSIFYNDDCRKGHSTGRFSMLPTNLHSAASAMLAEKHPNIFVAAVSPMDKDGYVYLSFDLQFSREAMDAADVVIFEVNSCIPIVFGDTKVPIDKADYIYEVSRPLPAAPAASASFIEKKIAEYVNSLINDGDCIQLGIGGMPNAVGEALLEKKDLGIHTEMLTSSMGRLIKAGAVTNARKNFNKGKTIGAFAWGDNDLYQCISENTSVELRKASYVNDPFNIAQNDNMVSVNTAIQIDLTGQVCSESVGSLQFSGTGGAFDFAYGAYHSKGGKGIIALSSTAKEGRISKIQPELSAGAIVSISRNIVDYVITEYGVARLKNRTVRQRAESLIEIAHPDFRKELRCKANKLMLW